MLIAVDSMKKPPDLFNGAELLLGDLHLQGLSLSGVRTSIALPKLDMAFDVAQGYPFLFPLHHFFISHVHMDHAGGIPYLISQKNMYHHRPASFYMPASMVDGMHDIMRTWEKLEGHTYKYHFIPVEKGFEFTLNKQFSVKAFPSTHRVDSFGYTLFQHSKKMKPQYQGQTEAQYKELHNQGIQAQEAIEEPLLTFTGDTQIEFLDSVEWVRKSKYLILEATYLDEAKPVEKAREWGHTHLDEIIPQLDNIHSEKIILIHVSSRYPTARALEILNKKWPKKHHDKLVLFPGR
jgi:ribonuclease Z